MATRAAEKNSRVIFLIAHSEDAPAILKQALNMNFQPDSVWVGPGSWPGEMYPDADWKFPSDSWVPGYLGLVPFRNDRSIYNTYLSKLSVYESANGLPISTHISQYGAETADAVVAMAIALNSLPADQRNDGSRVKEVLRSTSFAGVSGDVRFDENGELFGGKNPAGLSFSWHDERLASTIAKAWLSLPAEVRRQGWSEFKHKFNTSGVGGDYSVEDRTFLKTR